jgi:hypothetical protein
MSRNRTTRPVRRRLPALAGGAALGITVLTGPAIAAGPAVAAPAPAAAPLWSRSTPAEPVALPVGFRPEGVASGPGDTYYAGSLADGRIWTGDLSRGTGRQLLAGVTGRALRGMQYDSRSGLLWVTGQDGSTGIVLAVNARSGAVEHLITVPGAVFLNDLVVTRKAVWVTDSRVDRLTRLPLDRKGHPTGSQGYLPLGGPWPTPEGIRANGIRELPDGSLILDHSTAGGLWRVDPQSTEVSSIPVIGGPGIVAGDGIERDGKTVYVVRGSGQQEVSVLELQRRHGSWTATWVKALTSPALDVPSTATLVKRTLWAVNARFGVTDPATATFAVVPLSTR